MQQFDDGCISMLLRQIFTRPRVIRKYSEVVVLTVVVGISLHSEGCGLKRSD
jgi:hypothetical protein